MNFKLILKSFFLGFLLCSIGCGNSYNIEYGIYNVSSDCAFAEQQSGELCMEYSTIPDSVIMCDGFEKFGVPAKEVSVKSGVMISENEETHCRAALTKEKSTELLFLCKRWLDRSQDCQMSFKYNRSSIGFNLKKEIEFGLR